MDTEWVCVQQVQFYQTGHVVFFRYDRDSQGKVRSWIYNTAKNWVQVPELYVLPDYALWNAEDACRVSLEVKTSAGVVVK